MDKEEATESRDTYMQDYSPRSSCVRFHIIDMKLIDLFEGESRQCDG